MIYVDPSRPTGTTPRWRYSYSCHLGTDGELSELHDFAAWIGLKREWFEDHARHPHYDITQNKRRMAVNLGAQEVTNKEFVRKIRRR